MRLSYGALASTIPEAGKRESVGDREKESGGEKKLKNNIIPYFLWDEL